VEPPAVKGDRPGAEALDRPYLDAIARGAGDALAALVLAEEAWVHRRVETLDILSAELARRQMSVDFAVPSALRPALHVGEAQGLVPLAMLRKQLLRHFDLRDEHDEPVPVVAGDHTALLAGAALLAQASDAVPDLGPELAGRLLDVVRALDSATGRARLAALEAAAEEDPTLAALLAHEPAARLLGELAETYPLLAVLEDTSRRRVVKYRYDSFFAARPSARVAVGLDPLVVRVSVPAAARGARYHAEVVLPGELRSVGAALVDTDAQEVYDEDPEADRVALYAAAVPRVGRPEVVVATRPQRGGLPSAALGVACVVSAVLAVGALGGQLRAAVAGPPIAVLLAASALFAGAVVRAGEHRMVQELFAGPRRALVVAGAAAVIAAAALAFELGAVLWIWRAAFAVALVATGVLALFVWRCRPALRRWEYPWREP
jgi:hypothetical protein